jgi:hypothetical protein
MSHDCYAGVVHAVTAGLLLDTRGPHPVFLLSAACLLLDSLCAFLITEDREHRSTTTSRANPSRRGNTTFNLQQHQQVNQQLQQGPGSRGRATRLGGALGAVAGALQRVWFTIRGLDVCGRCCPGCDGVGAVQHVRWLVTNVWATLQQPHIRGCAIFIFLWQV